MAKRVPFEVRLDAGVVDHFDWIDARHHQLILDGIEEQLTFEPLSESRNRKPLARLDIHGAEWELRLGPGNRFRVFYRVDEENRVVVVAAVGVKLRSRLLIAGEEPKT